MSKRVKWAEIEEELNELGKPALLRLLKELYDASAGNQAFFAARFLQQGVTAEMREPYRQRIIHQFFPKRGFGKLDLRLARQAISDYRRATSDMVGTVDLMLTYVEQGTRFTNEYGDIEESFYNSLESVLGEAAKLAQSHPELYSQFQNRFEGLVRATRGIGWGYHDGVSEIVEELEMSIGATSESHDADAKSK